ncbi:MAG TPA: hypothetical protein VFK48_14910 [Usitatibacter sp.]|nr:hypothetical protein [Usitatibacter sp.]
MPFASRLAAVLLAAAPFAAPAAELAGDCAEIRAANPAATDGEYVVMSPWGKPLRVYCEDMASRPGTLVWQADASGLTLVPFDPASYVPRVTAGAVITKESCKDGGFRIFGVFKTQGDCVSFFASNGRNFPDL